MHGRFHARGCVGATSVLPLLLAAATFLVGCASTVERAAKLGTAGKDTAAQYARFYASVDEAAKAFYVTSLYITPHCSTNARACEEAIARRKAVLESNAVLVEEIRVSLSKRAAFAAALADTYDAFIALNDEKVREAFEKGLANLTNAVEAYAATLREPPSIPKFAAGVISQTGGIIIELIKAEMLRESSARIRTRLEAFLMIAQKDETLTNVFYRQLEENHRLALYQLWQDGLLRLDPAIAGTVAGYPAKLVETETRLTVAARTGAATVYEHHLERVAAERVKAVRDSQAKLLSSTRKLIEAHKKFEAGGELELGDLIKLAGEVRRMVEHFEIPAKK